MLLSCLSCAVNRTWDVTLKKTTFWGSSSYFLTSQSRAEVVTFSVLEGAATRWEVVTDASWAGRWWSRGVGGGRSLNAGSCSAGEGFSHLTEGGNCLQCSVSTWECFTWISFLKNGCPCECRINKSSSSVHFRASFICSPVVDKSFVWTRNATSHVWTPHPPPPNMDMEQSRRCIFKDILS